MFSIKLLRYGVFGFTFLFHLVLTFALAGNFPTGIDGYYNLKQIENLALTGQFYYQDYSFAFFPPALFTFLFPSYSILSLQLTNSLCYSLTITAVFLLTNLAQSNFSAENQRKKSTYTSLTVVALLLLTLPLYHFSFTYYKNLFAISMFLWAVYYYFKSINEEEKGRKSIYISLIFIVLALFSHKSIFVFLFLFSVSYTLYHFTVKRLIILAVLFSVFTILFFTIFANSVAYVSAIIDVFDFRSNFLRWFAGSLQHDTSVVLIYMFNLIAIILYFFVRSKIPSGYKTSMLTVILFLTFAIFPFQKFGYNEPSFRLQIFTPLFFLPAFFLLLTQFKNKNKHYRFLLSGLIVIFAGFFISEVRRIQLNFPDWEKIKNIEKITLYVSRDDHLIAHHGLEYYLNYITGIRARQWKSTDENQKKFRIAFVPERVMDKSDRTLFSKSALLKLSDEYYLVTEDSWQYYRENYFLFGSWKNPEMERPAHLHE